MSTKIFEISCRTRAVEKFTFVIGDNLLSILDPEWFRKKIALVGQEPVLFGVSIEENIAYGQESSPDEVHSLLSPVQTSNFSLTSFICSCVQLS